jgi:hypothetical protein
MTVWAAISTFMLGLFGQAASMLTSKYAMRAAVATLGVTLFFGLAKASWELVVNQFGVAAGNLASAVSNSDAAGAIQVFRCLMPSSTGAALTVMVTVFIQAVIILWTRRIIFLKMAD